MKKNVIKSLVTLKNSSYSENRCAIVYNSTFLEKILDMLLERKLILSMENYTKNKKRIIINKNFNIELIFFKKNVLYHRKNLLNNLDSFQFLITTDSINKVYINTVYTKINNGIPLIQVNFITKNE